MNDFNSLASTAFASKINELTVGTTERFQ